MGGRGLQTCRSTAATVLRQAFCCGEARCTLNTPVPAGYTVENEAGTTVSELGEVRCAADHVGTAAVACPADGQAFQLSGCAARSGCAALGWAARTWPASSHTQDAQRKQAPRGAAKGRSVRHS